MAMKHYLNQLFYFQMGTGKLNMKLSDLSKVTPVTKDRVDF